MLNGFYRSTQESTTTKRLSEEHRRMLYNESGIAREIAAERGYRTVGRAEVPPEFKGYQRRAGLLVPLFSPDGTTTGYQLRPDNPRRDKRGKRVRYETPAEAHIIADVHPWMHEAAADPSKALWITEGVKCGDALTSRGRAAVSLIGVWMYRKPGAAEMLACFDHIALRGRRVYVVFDSDVMRKPEVQMALERLVGDLEERGARVLVVYLEDAPDGSKMGVDDYLASEADGTVEHLEEIARPFTPRDASFASERMGRDATLREHIAELWRTWEGHDWRGIGGHTRREVFRTLIEDFTRRGEIVADGLRGPAAQRPLAERVGTRQATISAALRTLEADGLIRRDTSERRAEDAPALYIILTPGGEGRARAYQEGEMGGRRDGRHHTEKAGISRGYDPGDTGTRALGEIKRLRWSYVARTWRADGAGYEYEYIRRLGKIAGRVLEALVEQGGAATVSELAAAIGHSRPRDLRRRQLSKLEDAGIARIEGDNVVLADDWAEKLGIAREFGREYEAEKLVRERHQRQRKAYREYREKCETLSPDELARMRAEKRRTRREATEARRWRNREADKVLRPNYWAWRERQHLRETRADGYISDLAPEPEPPPKRPPKVGGVYQHGPLCDCEWCEGAGPGPRYVKLRGSA